MPVRLLLPGGKTYDVTQAKLLQALKLKKIPKGAIVELESGEQISVRQWVESVRSVSRGGAQGRP